MARRSWMIGLAWLALVSACLAVGLGRPALIDPDEGRNAAIAREMAMSGDFLVPHLNSLPFLDKPLLFFATQALAMRLVGAGELAARLPSLLFAWATIALTAWFSTRLFGRRSAWIAGTTVATAPLAAAMARTAIFDSMLSFFIVLAVCAFHQAVHSAREGGKVSAERPWTLVAWAAMALGVLTKGPVALLVPLLVAGAYAVWRRRSVAVWHPFGWLLFLGLVLPWALIVESRVPGFLHYALLTETWGRLTTGELQRTGPVWYFLPYLFAGCFPWIVVGANGLFRSWRGSPEAAAQKDALVFLTLWLTLPLVLFSLSQSKRPQYILPLIPAIALLAARAWSEEDPPRRGIRVAAVGVGVLGLIFMVAPYTRPWGKLEVDLAAAGAVPLVVLGGVMLVAGLLSWRFARRRDLAPVLLSLPLLALGPLLAPAIDEIARTRSAAEAAAAMRPHLTAETRIVGIATFSPSLIFYLGRPILVSTATLRPFGSNSLSRFAAAAPAAESPLRPAGWWWGVLEACDTPTIFVLREHYRGERDILAAAGLEVLFEGRTLTVMGPCRVPGALPASNRLPLSADVAVRGS
jgi:4-amino-4-deoxy-L-arabinose transferase-like glycosyltransferase